MARLGVGIVCLGLAGAAAACGTTSPKVSPAEALRQAQATIDATPALHFSLSSTHAQGKGATIVSGTGDAARPDSLDGSFTVAVDGLPVTVKVIGVGGRLYVQAPFTDRYALTNPAAYGIGDPAQLIDPTHGVSTILPALTSVTDRGQTRIGSEVAEEYTGTLPGTALPVLPDADRSAPVAATVDVIPASHQVRRMVLTGPFTSSSPSTYTVVLTDYGETVHIAAPGG